MQYPCSFRQPAPSSFLTKSRLCLRVEHARCCLTRRSFNLLSILAISLYEASRNAPSMNSVAVPSLTPAESHIHSLEASSPQGGGWQTHRAPFPGGPLGVAVPWQRCPRRARATPQRAELLRGKAPERGRAVRWSMAVSPKTLHVELPRDAAMHLWACTQPVKSRGSSGDVHTRGTWQPCSQ